MNHSLWDCNLYCIICSDTAEFRLIGQLALPSQKSKLSPITFILQSDHLFSLDPFNLLLFCCSPQPTQMLMWPRLPNMISSSGILHLRVVLFPLCKMLREQVCALSHESWPCCLVNKLLPISWSMTAIHTCTAAPHYLKRVHLFFIKM